MVGIGNSINNSVLRGAPTPKDSSKRKDITSMNIYDSNCQFPQYKNGNTSYKKGCRCDRCKTASREKDKRKRERYKKNLHSLNLENFDGKCLFGDVKPRTAYNKGCRCSRCASAISKKWSRRKVILQKKKKIALENQKNKTDCLFPEYNGQTPYSLGCRCDKCINIKSYNERKSRGKQVKKSIEKRISFGDKDRCLYPNLKGISGYKKGCICDRCKGAVLFCVNKRRDFIKKSYLENSKDDNDRIEEIYAKRVKITRETGILHHVDHIIPLSKGGKHVPNNLQIIPAKENLRKGSKIPPRV